MLVIIGILFASIASPPLSTLENGVFDTVVCRTMELFFVLLCIAFIFDLPLKSHIRDTSLYDNILFQTNHVTEYTGENGIDRFDETDFDNDDKAASLAVSDHRPGPPFTLMLTMIKGGAKCFDVYV